MIGTIQQYLFLALYLVVLVLCVVALVDVLRRPAGAFTSAGKRTRTFWLAVLAVATVVAFVAIPPPLGQGYLGFLALVSAVGAIVYLVDVRPAIAPYSGRGGGGRGRPGGRPGGGW